MARTKRHFKSGHTWQITNSAITITKELCEALVSWIPAGTRDLPLEYENEQNECAQAENDTHLVDGLPGIEINKGLETVGGSQKTYHKILKIFYCKNQTLYDEIRTAINGEDINTATRLAHTIKGVAGNIGAESLYDISARLESELKTKGVDAAVDLLDTFEDKLNTVLSSVRIFINGSSIKANQNVLKPLANVDMEKVNKIIEELSQIIEFDISEARSKVKQLKEILGETKEITVIETAIDDYDDNAMSGIERLKEQYS